MQLNGMDLEIQGVWVCCYFGGRKPAQGEARQLKKNNVRVFSQVPF